MNYVHVFAGRMAPSTDENLELHDLQVSWSLQCTLSVFQQNNPALLVLKPDCFAEKLTLCNESQNS